MLKIVQIITTVDSDLTDAAVIAINNPTPNHNPNPPNSTPNSTPNPNPNSTPAPSSLETTLELLLQRSSINQSIISSDGSNAVRSLPLLL